MYKEIGSEFWFEDNLVECGKGIIQYIQNNFSNIVLTDTGRTAINVILKNIRPIHKTVLMPAYICDSVIKAFTSNEYKIFFYDLNLQLECEDIEPTKNEVGVFLHIGYFGFSTNSSLANRIKEFKENGVIVIEDVTHTFFSFSSHKKNNDFVFGSFRKWLGVSSGGFLASNNKLNEVPQKHNHKFVSLRREAFSLKKEYMYDKQKQEKSNFLHFFAEAERHLDLDFPFYLIDDESKLILSTLNYEIMFSKRRRNYFFLQNELKNITNIKSVFPTLVDNVCPLFYPIYIETNRKGLRNHLNEHNIFCPIHWPKPVQVNLHKKPGLEYIYNSILSIPCDQRYSEIDMEKIVKHIRLYYE